MKTNYLIGFSIFLTAFLLSTVMVICQSIQFAKYEEFNLMQSFFGNLSIFIKVEKTLAWIIFAFGSIAHCILLTKKVKDKIKLPSLSVKCVFYSALIFFIIHMLVIFQEWNFQRFLALIDWLCDKGLYFEAVMEVVCIIYQIIGIFYFIVFDLKALLKKLVSMRNSLIGVFFACSGVTVVCHMALLKSRVFGYFVNDNTCFIFLVILHFVILWGFFYVYIISNLKIYTKTRKQILSVHAIGFLLLVTEIMLYLYNTVKVYNANWEKVNPFLYVLIANYLLMSGAGLFCVKRKLLAK